MRRTRQLTDEFDELKNQLAAAVEAITNLANRDEAASFSISEFCKRHRMSEAQYHKLKRDGRGPRVMSTGSMGVRISRAAEADWIIEREREAKQQKVERPLESAFPVEGAA
jgi:hypothetical protein